MFEFKNVYGAEIEKHISDLSRIRITVFKEWPYLYQGTEEYEKEYLKNYFENERSLCIFCYHEGQVVGISTLMPLSGEHEDLKKPVADFGFDIDKIFYYSETCLLKEFRGQGLYSTFFKKRDEHVKSFGSEYEKVCFCSVLREEDHPMKPKDYRPLYDIWKRYGYNKVDDLNMSFLWTDIGEKEETKKELSVWFKDI